MKVTQTKMLAGWLLALFVILGVIYITGCGGGGKDPLTPDDPYIPEQPNTPVEPGQLSDHITVDGITFKFDKEYPIGKFVNGDYWVAGNPVTITGITPEYSGDNNGWEVNPVVLGGQGFSKDLANYDSNLVPNFPYLARPTSSIIKTVRSNVAPGSTNCRRCLAAAAVLTVVEEPLESNLLFRPTYIGTNKRFFSVNDLQTDLLTKYQYQVDNISRVESDINLHLEEMSHLQLVHKNSTNNVEIRTEIGSKNEYGAAIGTRNGELALWFMLDVPIEKKMPFLIHYIQYGIDMIAALEHGYEYTGGGAGHTPGLKITMVYTAVMLNDDQMKQVVRSSVERFHERRLLSFSRDNSRVLYGDDQGYEFDKHETNYWKVVCSYLSTGKGNGYRSYSDPYGYIDGGGAPGDEYQHCCTSMTWKGSILTIKLMPELAEVWNDDVTTRYVERWVNEGGWAQPDPCAPAKPPKTDLNDRTDDYILNNYFTENYGVTFGPDGNGDCIRDTDNSDGIGRYPERQGIYKNTGYHNSALFNELWDKYVP